MTTQILDKEFSTLSPQPWAHLFVTRRKGIGGKSVYIRLGLTEIRINSKRFKKELFTLDRVKR